MKQVENAAQTMRSEMSILAQICGEVKSHPAFTQLREIENFSNARVDLLSQYVEQLENLLAKVNHHAARLRDMAKGDVDAAQLTIVAERIVRDVTKLVLPMIENLRGHIICARLPQL